MGIDIVKGRAFAAGDAIGSPVAVVNEALVDRFFKDSDPIGRRFQVAGPNSPMFTIVGVARNVKQGGLEAPAGTEIYFNFEQIPRILGFAQRQMNLVLETSRPLSSLTPPIRDAVRAIDPGLPIVQLRTMDDVVGASLTRQRFLSLLLGIFAAVALLLAAIGTYGVLAYMVSERHREIGIRMALGAGNGQVIGLVLKQGITIAAIGIVAGVAGALALSRITRSLLYGVDPADPATFVTVIAVISFVATAACVIPMRRATRVDPLTAIRAD
jgi:predicted permease